MLIDYVRPVVFNENLWDDLLVEAEQKRVIMSLAKGGMKRNDQKIGLSGMDQVRGTGGGVVIHIHGPAGRLSLSCSFLISNAF
jgi:hypothetical protein